MVEVAARAGSKAIIAVGTTEVPGCGVQGTMGSRSVQDGTRELSTRWFHYVAYFFGGAFLVNAVPHFVNGVSGRPFPTPFASPPGQGESSAFVNVLWGAFNLVVGYLLVCRVGPFDLRRPRHVLLAGGGGLLMAVFLARQLGRLYGGL